MAQDPLDAVRDPRRLEALRETGLLDSEIEEEFDRLTRLAAKLLGVPATFFSLVDEDRDFYKSCFGFSDPLASERQFEGTTFCHYSLVAEGALVIPDTRADPIYRTVPTVESMGVAAYLGVPIQAPGGEVLGSFCAIDFEPHDWSPLEVETMKELAKSAEREVAIRHWARRQGRLLEREREAKAEAERRRREVERLTESRSRIMRGFSHDVKNPLGAANGFLQLLEAGIMGPLEKEQKDSVARARRSIGAALGLIEDLLELARAEAGEITIERHSVDARDAAGEVAEEYRAQAEAKGLTTEVVLPDTLPVIESDAGRIRQILGNFFSNAVKYTPEGGRITARVGLREGGMAPGPGRWIAVDVSDTGPGIDKAKQHLLFQEFKRIEPVIGRGAGVGLAISKRIADALGGDITVASEIGGGSTFTLWLPAPSRGESDHRPRARDREPNVAEASRVGPE